MSKNDTRSATPSVKSFSWMRGVSVLAAAAADEMSEAEGAAVPGVVIGKAPLLLLSGCLRAASTAAAALVIGRRCSSVFC